ncbi:SDR family NAD(P)-dependent oxidoreductase [Streptomonospora litoralis]|uniref:Sulfoacetaldehyde reductase n=1 Tax=Streptomonospora litoralis TaxID=2498135 RepID=A0A4P6QAG5_9ACTN|nr:SDR family oxidoreductase [Streptomonospora litoralis]QBI56434.1 Sulfoacetaldehyde reductase [Streptomonospora litoralis]
MTIDHSSQTTLITGASSGIGADLARRLAERGTALVLVARRVERLEAVAAELRGAHGVQVETVSADLGRPGTGRDLAAEMDRRGIRVTSLINNAGIGADGAFADQDPDELETLLALNVTALVDITRAFIDRLNRAEGGYLVNIASAAAYGPIPGMAVYAASKAFVLNFTEALWWETRGSGLRTMAFSPGLTRSEFFQRIGTEGYGSDFQTPDEVARALVRALDRSRSVPSTVSRASTAVSAGLARLFNRKTTVLVTARLAGSAGLMSKRRPVGT